MTIYWSSTKAPVHLFARSYETPQLAAHIKENSFVDPAILAADLRIGSLSAMSVEAYQRRLGVRKINNPRGKI
jgi:hypothetical protein